MRLRHILSFLTLAFVLASTVPPRAAEVVGVSSKVIELEASKGALLRLKRDAGTIFVANPDVADVQVKSPRLIYLTAKKPGETTLYVMDINDHVLLSRRVHVRHNLSRLSTALHGLFPGASVDVRSVGDALVLSGQVANASQAEDAKQLAERIGGKNVVNRLSVAEPNQVHLRVKVAEVARSVIKRFGVNLTAAIRTPEGFIGLNSGDPFIQTPFSPLNPNANRTFLNSRSDTNTALFTFNNGDVDLNTLLDALDQEGLISVLAEPNLTAISGETADFLAGGEFPILVPGDNGQTTVTFKSFGVSLAFTPTVIDSHTINLKVAPEVSQLSSAGAVNINGFVIPALTTRRTETTVELGSGQSFAISGLLQNNVTRDLKKFPGLGELPILGPLFRSDRFERAETELVIIVTPYIVRPVSGGQIAAPNDGLTAPTDVDRIVRSRLYRPSPSRGRSQAQVGGQAAPLGAAGFMLD